MDLVTAIKATYEVIGQDISDIAILVLVEELKNYPLPDALAALTRCRKELRRVVLADILDRLPGGHPGPEAAWAIVSRVMNNEDVSLVWTDEMRQAYGVCRSLAKDSTAARMAFREDYVARVNQSRSNNQRPRWVLSLGQDVLGRELAVREAVSAGLLSEQQAIRLLPSNSEICEGAQQLIAQVCANKDVQPISRRKS